MAKVITKSAAVFIDMESAPNMKPAKEIKSTIPDEQFATMPWSPWGKNNLLPQEMVADIKTCGRLDSIIDGKARLATCDGIVPAIVRSGGNGKKVIESIVEDAEIVEFLEMNNHYHQTFGWMKDQFGIGNAVARLILNKGKDKVTTFYRDDVVETRFEKKTEGGKIKNLYYAAEWNLIQSERDSRMFKIPLLAANNPLQDLKDKAAAGIVEHSMSFRYPGWGTHYYAVPQWYSVYKWVKIAQGVPEMKAAMYANAMRLKYLVTVFEAYWQDAYDNWDDMDTKDKEEAKTKLYDEINDCLTGAKNSHKTLFIDGKLTVDGKPAPYITVEAIPDSTVNGEYLPDSAAANSEIAFAMNWNNAMEGGNQKNGLYSENQGGSNVREASTLQVSMLEMERKNVLRVMNVIKYFNGWNKTYPGLEFIIPATLLTTLDTGAGSKPVVTGGMEPKKEKDNGTDTNSSGS